MQHFTFDTNDPAPIFAHITAAGAARGITPESLNRLIERHERDRVRTVTLSTADWHRVDDEQTPPSAAQAVQP